MTETYLTTELMKACCVTMPHAEVLKHHGSRFTKDYPDVSVSWAIMTSWWEVKFYDNGPFTSSVGQDIRCARLARQSRCHYVIYEQRRNVKRTLIVHPDDYVNWEQCSNYIAGFNHVWVASFIRQLHEHHR